MEKDKGTKENQEVLMRQNMHEMGKLRSLDETEYA